MQLFNKHRPGCGRQHPPALRVCSDRRGALQHERGEETAYRCSALAAPAGQNSRRRP